ncbi:PAS domain-containing sensor histidine kinase [Salinigranum sp.]|uniref:PAS domain-containing sensor histidine kinase n=1 Tax=Salinigranum sp. TaxID=1966351 RepID=UPI003563833D
MVDDSPPDVRERLLSLFEESSVPYTVSEVVDRLDVDRSVAASFLSRLVDQGRLETKVVGADTPVWWAPSPDTAGTERSTPVPTLDDALGGVDAGVVVFDERLRFSYLNDAAGTFLSLPPSSVVGRDARDVDTLSGGLVDALESALAGDGRVVRESRPVGDLEAGWVEYDVSPSPAGVTMVVDDVSEQRRLERELRTETEQFRTALQNSPLVAFRLDTDLRYTWIGNSHEDFDESAVLGKRDDDLLPPEAAEVVMTPKRTVLETGEGVREEVTYDVPSGEVTYDLTVEPLRDETGTLVGLTAAALDVTEQKQHERQLREQNERLDRLTEVLSHDLRGPLSVATGRLRLFGMDSNPQHLDAARRAHERMSALIDDVLTAPDSHEAADETTTVSLARAAQEAWDHVETADAALCVDVDADHTVEANESKLHQLFENLFRNSVEHGSTDPHSQAREDSVEHGSPDAERDTGVTVRVGPLADPDGFFVADDGRGFSLVPAAGDVFDDGYSTSEGGTGLGLGIVRDVAMAHGWTVRAVDAAEGGARFEFRLDADAADPD